MIEAFDQYARDAGVELQYRSGYRTPEHQARIRSGGTGTTPAQNSLHSAGWAVDVQYRGLPADQQKIIRDAAAKAGLSWGGNLRQPDINHFYFDPDPGRRLELINTFTDRVMRLDWPRWTGGTR